ncbi:MAG: hypothetical protein R3E78_04995 [Burkholderiaceae bacterium]
MNLVLFVVGMIVNDITAIILLAPLLMPLMKGDRRRPGALRRDHGRQHRARRHHATLRLDPAWARASAMRVVEVVGPALRLLLLGFLPTVLLTTYWPELALFFPRLFGY